MRNDNGAHVVCHSMRGDMWGGTHLHEGVGEHCWLCGVPVIWDIETAWWMASDYTWIIEDITL